MLERGYEGGLGEYRGVGWGWGVAEVVEASVLENGVSCACWRKGSVDLEVG